MQSSKFLSIIKSSLKVQMVWIFSYILELSLEFRNSPSKAMETSKMCCQRRVICKSFPTLFTLERLALIKMSFTMGRELIARTEFLFTEVAGKWTFTYRIKSQIEMILLYLTSMKSSCIYPNHYDFAYGQQDDCCSRKPDHNNRICTVCEKNAID